MRVSMDTPLSIKETWPPLPMPPPFLKEETWTGPLTRGGGGYPEGPIPEEMRPHFIWHYEHVLRPAGPVQALPLETCSQACNAFFSEILVREPSARLTAVAALNHP